MTRFLKNSVDAKLKLVCFIS